MSPVLVPSLKKILHCYMEFLLTADPVRSVSDLCRRVKISRTTFYKHFESLEDLDERFLHLYFGMHLGPSPQLFTNYDELAGFYGSLARAMRDQRGFFCRVVILKEHARYFSRWRELVDERLLSLFQRPGMIASPALWKLHLDLGLGVVHRFMELSLSAPQEDLEELIHWTMEYLWGGMMRFKDLFEGVVAPMNNQITRRLEWRASHRTGPNPPRSPLFKPRGGTTPPPET